MLVITMTSWTARINNVVSVLQTVLNQSILPDIIYLNLSEEEFFNKVLPEDLVALIENSYPLIKLNWVSGPNTKPFKKIFPILRFLNSEDIIINIDDDMLLPANFIESRLRDFKKYNTCISGLQSRPINGYAKGRLPEVRHYLGAGSVYQKKMFNHWAELLNDEIIKTNHDDAFYCFLAWLNGYTPECCSEMDSRTLETLAENETAIHGCVGCYGPKAATEINIKRFKDVFKTLPRYNFFKTNLNIKQVNQPQKTSQKTYGRPNTYLYF